MKNKVTEFLWKYRAAIGYTIGVLNVLSGIVNMMLGNVAMGLFWASIGLFIVWDTKTYK